MALLTGAPTEALEREFGIEDIGEKIARVQIAHYFGWSLDEVDALTGLDWIDVMAYMSARNKVESTRRG